jgi:hypothetical protein
MKTFDGRPRMAEGRRMSSNNNNCGCIIILAVVIGVGSIISSCNDKHSSAPRVSQPSTGYVAPAPRYEAPERPSIPTVAEPFGQLQSGGFAGASSALKMKNDMSTPAYVKIYDSSRNLRATIYLRAGESYELGVTPDSYQIKYVTGPGSEWRGTSHYFGSSSTFYADKSPDYIGHNQRLSVTFYTVVTRGGSAGGNLNKIGEDDF